MDNKKDSYPGNDHFHQVIALHEDPTIKWEDLSRDVPLLPRGWYELSRLSKEDRIEFTLAFWLSKLALPSSKMEAKLEAFFENVEDIGIFLTQARPQGPFDIHMVYSLKDAVGFFQGGPPATVEAISILEKQFQNFKLPPDYLAFLQIHDGFSKYMDTGLIKIREMSKTYQRFQELFGEELPERADGENANPAKLIPFYESYGLHTYQCFYADWYPDEEMGNVYFVQDENVISNFFDPTTWEENLAFPTFVSWLLFYLEDLFHS